MYHCTVQTNKYVAKVKLYNNMTAGLVKAGGDELIQSAEYIEHLFVTSMAQRPRGKARVM